MGGLLKYFFIVVLASLAVLAFAACDEVTTRAQLEGILQNVDSISGEVTVKLKDGGTVTFNLKDVNVETLRKAIGNASLEAGSPVTLETDKGKKVKTVKARHVEVEGIIKSVNEDVNKDKKTVTIASEKGGEITLEVT
jgi:biopolymer transport protein ExbD